MHELHDVQTLGVIYTITDDVGKELGKVQVLFPHEITDVAFGEYNDTFIDYRDYLIQSKECFSGQDEDQLYRTLWWCRTCYTDKERDHDLLQAFEYAIQHNYTTIIIEDIVPSDS